MSRVETGAVVVVVVVAAWVVATALPAWSEVAWAGGVLVLLAIALVRVTLAAIAMRQGTPARFESLLRGSPARAARPADLERIERLTGWGAYSEHDFDQRLRPIIVTQIQRRLRLSGRIPPGADVPLDRELLSPELAALLEPSPAPRSSPITTEDLSRALDAIEAL